MRGDLVFYMRFNAPWCRDELYAATARLFGILKIRMNARGNPVFFAKHKFRDFAVYKTLAASEPHENFKKILEEFIVHEHEDYLFWQTLAREKRMSVQKIELWFFKVLRKVFGLVFTVRVLEARAKKLLGKYHAYLGRVTDAELRLHIARVIEHETRHERSLIAALKEKNVTFLSSAVLGLNDGLIELTGALVGFSFALGDHLLIAGAGSVTGISASLSMASSAYMQARYDEHKNPRKVGMATGTAYLAVVVLLVAPFFIFDKVFLALGVMFAVVFVIINAMSFYSAILLQRKFIRQAGELFMASIGVGAVAFVIGSLFRFFTGSVM